jgi:hypothetical protein
MAVFRPLAALITAILAGLADNFLIGEESEIQNFKKQETPGKKARVLAVSALIGTSVQGKTYNLSSCNLSSCSCNKSVISNCQERFQSGCLSESCLQE